MSIADTLADLPDADRQALERVVETARRLAPDAVDGVSYGVPTLKVDGRPLIGVQAAAAHLSIFPFSPPALDTVRADLAGFSVSKGTVRFTAQAPVPQDVLERLITARLAEIRG